MPRDYKVQIAPRGIMMLTPMDGTKVNYFFSFEPVKFERYILMNGEGHQIPGTQILSVPDYRYYYGRNDETINKFLEENQGVLTLNGERKWDTSWIPQTQNGHKKIECRISCEQYLMKIEDDSPKDTIKSLV